jgi:hypothetical protein
MTTLNFSKLRIRLRGVKMRHKGEAGKMVLVTTNNVLSRKEANK